MPGGVSIVNCRYARHKAHADLDRAVDQCYRQQPFTSDRQRVEFLFALYERFTAPLLPVAKKAGGARRRA